MRDDEPMICERCKGDGFLLVEGDRGANYGPETCEACRGNGYTEPTEDEENDDDEA